ncbi:MAG TPA: T9SS type A sorting domain-containing protein [candidate division Zixibacteria bacterium]|nr:T9SS type A sorting domain-containing protein [candidate division Zixibacteria bacterium]MDD4918391.1 T9SS type A sorting domain-containing protein [candidate division Zixibacteria bacterium]MDM7972413.1 T9SS type A sorting domain-containing protein [candidate division Zixibacteria bacterium]HOD66044.1 T9SS type A sorting domain-containing protein [candidate division Zixibacteria bacterium]HPI32995.1 T9SS type A sorting domain-containing protein [candidate division Zixibacteria bacterium]
MRKLLLTVLAVLLCAAGSEAVPPVAPWAAQVTLDTVAARPGQHVAVPIRLSNNDQVSTGIYIPLRLASSSLTVDSVSFVGSIMTADFTGMAHVSASGLTTVEIALAPNLVAPIPTIPAVNGIIARLWVTVSPSAPLGLARIDSLAIDSALSDGGPAARLWKYVQGATAEGVTMMPGFRAGGVLVESPTGIEDEENLMPGRFELAQNYPNPFNPSTTIGFTLPTAQDVQLVVYNVLGQEIATLVNGRMAAGSHQVTFEASGRPSGVYFYRLTYEDGVETRKMTLVK